MNRGRAGGRFQSGPVGGEVGAPGLKPRDQVPTWAGVRKKRDSYAGAVLAQGNVGLLKNV